MCLNNARHDLQMKLTNEAQLEEEKIWFKKYALIHTGKLPSESSIRTNCVPRISQKMREQGFEFNIISMIRSLDSVNENIAEVYRLWDMYTTGPLDSQVYSLVTMRRIQALNSYIIHDIKKFIDDVIAIFWIMNHDDFHGTVQIDCIGKYLNIKDGSGDIKDFNDYEDFLKLVNNIENAYKHSIVYQFFPISDENGPIILVRDGNHNKDIFHPTVHQIHIKDLICQFNKFYTYTFNLIEKKSGFQNNEH